MPTRRPRNLRDREALEENHDDLFSTLPPDHPVVGMLKDIVSTPLLSWRSSRDCRVGARGTWQVGVLKQQKADKKCDDRARTAFRVLFLKHGQDAIDDLIKCAGGNNLTELVRMPVERALVIYAELFASVDSAPEAPVSKDDLEKLREAVEELGEASLEESKARKQHAHATAAELEAAGALDLAFSRFAKAIEGVYGPADAALYLPKFAPQRGRDERAPTA